MQRVKISKTAIIYKLTKNNLYNIHYDYIKAHMYITQIAPYKEEIMEKLSTISFLPFMEYKLKLSEFCGYQ